MLVQIGRRPAPRDVVDLLLECHGRIRLHTDLARRLSTARDLPPAEIREVAAAVRRYFAEALPLHVQDEEEEVTSRLSGKDPAVDQALARMSAEHADHEPSVARLIAICEHLERDPAFLGDVAGDLAALAAGLEARFAAHLELEERVIFSALRRLPEADRRALLTAVRARRATRPE